MALVPLAFAVPDAQTLQERWELHNQALQTHTSVPVKLVEQDFQRLAKAGVMARRIDSELGTFATAAVWVPERVWAPWVVVSDAPHAPPTRLVATRLPVDLPLGENQVHSLLKLPWPFASRQWVNHLKPNRELHEVDPALWQRTWAVVDPSIAPNPHPSATWVDENTGAWTMLDGEDGTLVVFSLRTVLGGAIPTGISQRFAVLGLADALKRVGARASDDVAGHYDENHTPVYGPDGAPLPPGFEGLL